MCWSPTADLLAGGVIAALGVASVSRVARAGRARDLPLAALPLLLGAHQLIESVIWSGREGGMDAGWAATAWAVIAYPLLPAFVPLAVLLTVGRERRPRLIPFVVLGLATSAVLAYALASGPITAEAVGHTMRYGVHSLPLTSLVTAVYLVATIGALLAADQSGIRLLGAVCGVGALVCGALWQFAFVSTWCALAAVGSLVLLRWSWSSGRGRAVVARPAHRIVR